MTIILIAFQSILAIQFGAIFLQTPCASNILEGKDFFAWLRASTLICG